MDKPFQLFENELLVEIESNRPFLLNKPGRGWFINEGRIDVFSVRVRQGVPSGSRTHHFTAGKGEILLSVPMPEAEEGIHFLAVAAPKTVIREFRLLDLKRIAGDERMNQMLLTLIDKWTAQLANGISLEYSEVSGLHTKAGMNQVFSANSFIHSRKQVVWLEITEGDALLLGLIEVRKDSQSTLIPITGELWLQSLDSLKGNCFSTADALKTTIFWDSLDHFYYLLLVCLEFKYKLSRVDQLNLLKEKSEFASLSQSDTLYRIASVVNRKIRKNYLASREDPMLAACKLVARYAGIPVKKPVKPRTEEQQSFTFQDVMHASRFRTRKVKLDAGWWKKDTGSLLGFTGSEQKPVALVQQGPGKMICIDPVSGTRQRMTASLSKQLQPYAWQFYPPLPDKVIDGKELVSFGIRNCRREIVIVLILALVGGLLSLLVPMITGFVFDQIIPYGKFRLLAVFGAILVLSAFSVSLFQLIRSLTMVRLETKIDFILQSAVWDRLLNLPVPFFRKYTSGELALKTNSILMLRKAMSDTVVYSLLSSVALTFNIIFLFLFSFTLGLITVGILVITIFVVTQLGIRMKKLQAAQINVQNKLYGVISQLLTGIAKIKTTGSEIHAFEQWANRFARVKTDTIALRKINITVQQILTFTPVFVLTLMFMFLHLFNSHKMSTGEFMTFYTAFNTSVLASMGVAGAVTAFFMAIPLYNNVRPILETLPENHQAKPATPSLQGSIDIANLSFRYHEKSPLVLKNVSIHINPGEFVAVVGPSGSGKSTLLRLLLGFDTPETGTICYDHHDLAMTDPESIRRRIGTVMQNSQLFPGSIFTNIAGITEATPDDVYDAAKLAGIIEDIEEMPMGMFTVISEGISTLSGGQRQRILIARALVTKPRILFFDEATSALDNKTQHIVSKSLENLNATRLVIAHRLSTVINADRIFVMENGEIVESGTYNELQAQGGKFADLVKRQMLG